MTGFSEIITKFADSAQEPKEEVVVLKGVETKLIQDETSHEEELLTQEDDYSGEFHMAIKKQIIDIWKVLQPGR